MLKRSWYFKSPKEQPKTLLLLPNNQQNLDLNQLSPFSLTKFLPFSGEIESCLFQLSILTIQSYCTRGNTLDIAHDLDPQNLRKGLVK